MRSAAAVRVACSASGGIAVILASCVADGSQIFVEGFDFGILPAAGRFNIVEHVT